MKLAKINKAFKKIIGPCNQAIINRKGLESKIDEITELSDLDCAVLGEALRVNGAISTNLKGIDYSALGSYDRVVGSAKRLLKLRLLSSITETDKCSLLIKATNLGKEVFNTLEDCTN